MLSVSKYTKYLVLICKFIQPTKPVTFIAVQHILSKSDLAVFKTTIADIYIDIIRCYIFYRHSEALINSNHFTLMRLCKSILQLVFNFQILKRKYLFICNSRTVMPQQVYLIDTVQNVPNVILIRGTTACQSNTLLIPAENPRRIESNFFQFVVSVLYICYCWTMCIC